MNLNLVKLFCLLFALKPVAAEPPKIADVITTCKGMEATVVVSQMDSKEMEKIGKDFSSSYRMKNLHLYYKNPDKIRIEASSRLLGDALLIFDGAKRYYAVSKLSLRKIEDLEMNPAKRQSLLEYGAQISEGTLQFMTANFVKAEKLGETPTLVFELKYKTPVPASSYQVWVDPKTRLTLKRVWYDKDGKVKATFLYTNPKEAGDGVWVPSRCEIKNAEGVLAAAMDFKEAKVPSTLDDALFEIKP